MIYNLIEKMIETIDRWMKKAVESEYPLHINQISFALRATSVFVPVAVLIILMHSIWMTSLIYLIMAAGLFLLAVFVFFYFVALIVNKMP